MQTIERPTTPHRRPPSPRWTVAAGIAAAAALLPLILLAIFTRWGVLILVVVALAAGLGIWIWHRGFVLIEIVAFLIHVEGLGFGPITTGRIMATLVFAVLALRLLSGWRPPAIDVRAWGPIWALTLWAVISGLWSAEAGPWFLTFGVYGLGVAYFCTTALLVDSHRMVQQFLRAYWYGGLLGSAAGIVGLVIGARSVGLGQDPNFFGLLQASMIPLTIYYRRHATTIQAKHLYTLTLLVVLAGAAGAGSRSGLIGGALAIVGTIVTRPGLDIVKRGRAAVGAVVLASFAALVGFVANPANLQRGISDRGAGRLDLWAVSIELIKQNPIIGYGFGQLKGLIPPNLLLVPGSERLDEFRSDVSAHNTWLDVIGDLGVPGLILFVSVFVVAMVGFARPRFLQTKELSTTLFVMMLPVLSGSFFLPLLNNKLSWALIGLSALLQVPSHDARWSGVARSLRRSVAQGGTGAGLARRDADELDTLSERSAPEPIKGERGHAPGEEVWEPVRLARWDLRLSRRFRTTVVGSGLVGAILLGGIVSTQPTTYTATAGILVPRLDGSAGQQWVAFDRERLQGALTMGVSTAYAASLRQLSGIDLDVREIADNMAATRPEMGNYVEFAYTDTDPARVEAVMPHMIDALDDVYESAQEFARPRAEETLRPIVPGEARIYDGPAYFRAYRDATFSEEPPGVAWAAFVGFAAGAFLAAGVLLAGQRRPRVTTADDLWRHLRMRTWAHVGGASRRRRATREQYAQVLAMARSFSEPDELPRRIVVAPTRTEPLGRDLALGLAAEVVARGGRALLVDAEWRRPGLTGRLGGLLRPGLADVGAGSEDLVDVIRRVHPLRLGRRVRRTVGVDVESLRFVPSGRVGRRRSPTFPQAALDRVDPSVTVIVMAPPAVGEVPVAPVLGWGDAIVVPATLGRTATADLEDAAVMVRTLSSAPSGVVLIDG